MATTLQHNTIVTCDYCQDMANERIIECSDMLDGTLSDREKISLIEDGWFFFTDESDMGGDKCHCPTCVKKLKASRKERFSKKGVLK